MKNMIPIIVQTVAKHSYWVESIFTGLRKSAEKSYYELELISNADTLDHSNYSENDTIIVIGYAVDWLYKTLDTLIEKGFRPIVVNAGVSSDILKKCNGVYFSLEESIETAIDYLKAAGRKNICLFGTNNMSLSNRIKEDTFRKVIKFENEKIESLIITGENSINDRIEEFLNRFEEREIDAAICQNDTLAIHLINRMLKDGFKIPDDLYIIGMGNSLLGQKMAIPLSSIELNYEELGVQAFSLWKYIQRSSNDVHVEVAIPCRFIPRASTGNFAMVEINSSPIFKNISYENGIETNSDEFYDDADIQKILMFEVFLRSCDKIDDFVLEGILNGISDTKMADMYNISDRAIRYRINKMAKKLRVQSREEIVSIIKDLRMYNDSNQ